ncbi:unnamed protein product [Closterium sp. NIES-54]
MTLHPSSAPQRVLLLSPPASSLPALADPESDSLRAASPTVMRFLRTDTSLPPFYVLVYVNDLVFATADPEALTLVLQHFGFQFSSPQPTPLSIGHSLSAPPSDESVEPSGPYPELVGCLMSTSSSSVLSSSCEAEIYAGAMAAQELRWLTYLLIDLGEQPRSPPVLYIDNKAMIDLCREHRLEHRTKHIALQYFLPQDLQQRGQLRLAYVATRANTADMFTKALPPGSIWHLYCNSSDTTLGAVAAADDADAAVAASPIASTVASAVAVAVVVATIAAPDAVVSCCFCCCYCLRLLVVVVAAVVVVGVVVVVAVVIDAVVAVVNDE